MDQEDNTHGDDIEFSQREVDVVSVVHIRRLDIIQTSDTGYLYLLSFLGSVFQVSYVQSSKIDIQNLENLYVITICRLSSLQISITVS